MSEAVRIQRKRVKGWKMPENTVYVGRPTRWGNPWSALSAGKTSAEVVAIFRNWIDVATIDPAVAGGRRGSLKELVRASLRGKNLACWCPLEDKDGNRVPCHADVLLEIANE